MTTFITENIVWIMTVVFGAGGLAALMRQLVSRLDAHENNISARFDTHERRVDKRFDKLDENDIEHDKAIADLQVRMARQEERTEVLSEMRTQIQDIWKLMMRRGSGDDSK